MVNKCLVLGSCLPRQCSSWTTLKWSRGSMDYQAPVDPHNSRTVQVPWLFTTAEPWTIECQLILTTILDSPRCDCCCESVHAGSTPPQELHCPGKQLSLTHKNTSHLLTTCGSTNIMCTCFWAGQRSHKCILSNVLTYNLTTQICF